MFFFPCYFFSLLSKKYENKIIKIIKKDNEEIIYKIKGSVEYRKNGLLHREEYDKTNNLKPAKYINNKEFTYLDNYFTSSENEYYIQGKKINEININRDFINKLKITKNIYSF